jgi:formate dehydrogenase major subunit
MAITRRDFLKISGITSAGILFGVFDLKPIAAYAQANPPVWSYETNSICCYCAVGCGLIVGTTGHTSTDQVTYVQGDPDHPINRGSLCSKGGAIAQLRTVDGVLNPRRLTQPLVRRPYSNTWTSISWNQALNEIVTHIRTTRDTNTWNAYTNPTDPGIHPRTVTAEEIDGAETPVNRCTGIASLGGAAHDTEECYLLVKMLRALGLVYIEHQARI